MLIQQGVVAIAKVGLSSDQVALLRQTGVVVVTDVEQGADVAFAQEAVEKVMPGKPITRSTTRKIALA